MKNFRVAIHEMKPQRSVSQTLHPLFSLNRINTTHNIFVFEIYIDAFIDIVVLKKNFSISIKI